MVDWKKGGQTVRHQLQPVLAQCRIVAAVVAYLVEDGALQQVCRRYLLVAVQCPVYLLPGQPIADLGVRREQQHLAAGRQLDRQYQTRVIGRRVEVQRKLRGSSQPVLIDPPPTLILLPGVGAGAVIVALQKCGGCLGHSGVFTGFRRAKFAAIDYIKRAPTIVPRSRSGATEARRAKECRVRGVARREVIDLVGHEGLLEPLLVTRGAEYIDADARQIPTGPGWVGRFPVMHALPVLSAERARILHRACRRTRVPRLATRGCSGGHALASRLAARLREILLAQTEE